MSLWGGRFKESVDQSFKKFNDSLKFDYHLVKQDIISSIAWSKALLQAQVININEQNQLENALNNILAEIEINPIEILKSNFEDIHSFIENKLITKLGSLGKKIHTGRSRNDQVTTDLKLWCRDQIYDIINLINNFQKVLVYTAENNKKVIIPGYTHLQHAQPITFAHWCLAYFEMFLRDKSRLNNCLSRLQVSPLGCGSLAGTAYNIDRDQLASWLGFSTATSNSLDTVADRDYVLELLSNAAISMIHLSRYAEDLIFFNTHEAGFIELSDQMTSGSSLMPQKKNPDALELIRGKCGRVQGALMSMMVTMKALPLSYNKDMQEDKEGLFDAVDTWKNCLNIASLILKCIKINSNRSLELCKNSYSNATEFADFLVKKGVPFREAHNIVGKIVLQAMEHGVNLQQLTLQDMKQFSDVIDEEIYSVLSLDYCINKKNVKGGTSLNQVSKAIIEAKKHFSM